MIDPKVLGLEVGHRIGEFEVRVKCPYHDDSTPSAEFNVKTGLFYCFVCGTGKTAVQVASDLGGRVSGEMMEAKRIFSDPDPSWRTRFMACRLATGNAYLRARGVSDELIKTFEIREAKDGVVFPMFESNGSICGVQVRYYERNPKYVFYGKRPGIWPLHFLTGGPTFLVEGVFSVLRGRSAGFSTFASLGSVGVKIAQRYLDRSNTFGIFDPDQAGYLAMAKLTTIGIPCIRIPFEADEEPVERWRDICNPKNFTMDVSFFAKKAIEKGARFETIIKQIAKFEKENS